ncbi:MAG: hypothetical protein CME19_09325 [Gemmatimonadetes bacterium]|nr:hypothetical protein [Gemmatimonadota bacterium]
MEKVTFSKPKARLYTQRADTFDVLTRLLAAKALGDKKDEETLVTLGRLNRNEDNKNRVRDSSPKE